MTNIKKVAAGIIAGAAITAGPLVAFAAPAFADTGAAKPVADAPSHMNIPPSGNKRTAKEQHVLVNSAAPETHSGRDDDGDGDGDGFHEVHVNTAKGFWSLLRSWLRPHRGISQEKLPLYLGFFQFVHNARVRGKGLLGPLLELLVA